MTSSSPRDFVDPVGNADEDVVHELLDTVKKAHRLRHLYDIFQGDAEDPAWYYEDSTSVTNPNRWASYLANSHRDLAVQFMNRADAEFSHHNLAKNAVVDFLAEREMSRYVLEELEPTWTELLILAYHELYDLETGTTSKYDLLIANARLFKHRSNHAYQYNNLKLDNLEERVTEYVRVYNRDESNRPLGINCHPIEEDEAVLDFYQESARVAEAVFDFRLEEDSADPDNPRVKYDSRYSIKTLSANIKAEEDGYVISYSKSPGNWESFLQDFLPNIFNIKNPLEDEQRKRTESVEAVLDSAREALSKDDPTDEDVIEAVSEPIDSLADETATSETAERLGYEQDELEDIFDSIEVVGIRVKDVDEAFTHRFEISSTATLHDWTDKNVRETNLLKSVVEDADKDSIGFLLRGNLRGEGGTPEEFVLQDGVWKPNRGGVSDSAANVLNELFKSNHE